jgi:hypothetical protein
MWFSCNKIIFDDFSTNIYYNEIIVKLIGV